MSYSGGKAVKPKMGGGSHLGKMWTFVLTTVPYGAFGPRGGVFGPPPPDPPPGYGPGILYQG